MVERDQHDQAAAPGPTPRPAPRAVPVAGAGGDWRHGAACRSTDPAVRVDPEVFFPTAEAGPERAAQVAAAKAVCARCPVLAACRAWALDELAVGVAGGLDEDERRAVRTTRRAAARAAAPRRVSVPVSGGVR